MDYKLELQNNNIDLNAILDSINALPDAGSSSGDAELNFVVVGGTTQPINPTENMIWVDTDTPITGYIFSATQPEAPTDGGTPVWIATSTSSLVDFSATKNNPIMVYPISIKQYVNDDWADVTAKSYQNDEWKDWWNGELFLYGNGFDGVTGGWTVASLEWHVGDDSNPGTLNVEQSSNGGVKLTVNQAHGALWHTANRIDLTGRNTIKFVGSLLKSTSTKHTALGIYPELDQLEGTTEAEITGWKEYGTYSFDISAVPAGSYYIGFRVYSTGEVIVDELYFE